MTSTNYNSRTDMTPMAKYKNLFTNLTSAMKDVQFEKLTLNKTSYFRGATHRRYSANGRVNDHYYYKKQGAGVLADHLLIFKHNGNGDALDHRSVGIEFSYIENPSNPSIRFSIKTRARREGVIADSLIYGKWVSIPEAKILITEFMAQLQALPFKAQMASVIVDLFAKITMGIEDTEHAAQVEVAARATRLKEFEKTIGLTQAISNIASAEVKFSQASKAYSDYLAQNEKHKAYAEMKKQLERMRVELDAEIHASAEYKCYKKSQDDVHSAKQRKQDIEWVHNAKLTEMGKIKES